MLYHKKENGFYYFYESVYQMKSIKTLIADEVEKLCMAKAIGSYELFPKSFNLYWGYDKEEIGFYNQCIFTEDDATVIMNSDFSYMNPKTNKREGYKRTFVWKIFKGQSFKCIDENITDEFADFLKEIWQMVF